MIYAQVQSIVPPDSEQAGCGNANGCQLGVWATHRRRRDLDVHGRLRGRRAQGVRDLRPGTSTTAAGDYPQNWYDQGIAVDPNNADRIFVDTFDVWLATRTGTALLRPHVRLQRRRARSQSCTSTSTRSPSCPARRASCWPGTTAASFGTLNADVAGLNTTRPTWFNMDLGFNTIEFYSGDISGNFADVVDPVGRRRARRTTPRASSAS